ncbi:hypothetical protein CIW49_13510 [Mycolicibacterium sp. P1-18]|uniref:hypothetical protein n=1 Tax=Mycolicibacterium sp. P1-18 TaxID=2024615 RepID=UPI0011F30E5B|nr:hypothetical protein [Mycolicibacterium sp. P1-18]KAA0098889.1 hypothetical protein CIW49_13510 [Mycolicibacterium sp. P1-18]
MDAMKHDKWYKLVAGDYVMTTWHDDSQLTYRVVRDRTHWMITRKVDGGAKLVIAHAERTFRDAQAVVQRDAGNPF